MPQTTITNLPQAQVVNAQTKINLATAITKAIKPFVPFGFMGSQNMVQTEYQSIANNSAEAQVTIKPVLPKSPSITSYNATGLLTLSDFDKASYGKITIPLDYVADKKFQLPSVNADFGHLSFAQMETDLAESALKDSILPTFFENINSRLRTSAFATNIGTFGTAVNAGVFLDLRNAFDEKGHTNERIEVRVHPAFYHLITLIPEFQNVRGTVPTVGNNMTENTGITNTRFPVEGQYNIDFIKDFYYLRPTPASDPIATATIKKSAAVPFRGLAETDPTMQAGIFEPITGLNLRYDKEFERLNVGETLLGRIQGYYGFAEISGDINQAGVVQSAPIFNILGGKA